MFLSAGLGNLVNQQAIQLTKSNAYQAARIVLGTSAPMAQAMKAAQDYTEYIIPKLNRYATVPQILGDLEFARFVAAAKDQGESFGGRLSMAEQALGGGGFGLTDRLLGIPNYLLYGGLLAAGIWIYRKKKSGGLLPKFLSKPPASVVPSASATPTPEKAA